MDVDIADNFITAGGDSNAAAVYLLGGDYISFVYNNVLMLNIDTVSCNSANFAIVWESSYGVNPDYVAVTNNNFVNSAGGALVRGEPFYGQYGYPTYCDYNNYYTANEGRAFNNFDVSKRCHSWFNLAGYSTLTGYDRHSLFMDPEYVSTSDLHISNSNLFRKGNPEQQYNDLYTYPTDIDGEPRPNPPTIGADEMPDTFPYVICKIASPGITGLNIACMYQPTQFADSSVSNKCGNITYRHWDFGDGTQDTGAAPIHTYTWIGYRTIHLIVITKGGCEDSSSYQIFIDSTCVWPGDVDCNKTVDLNDVLKLADAYGANGYKRPNATAAWYGQPCLFWKNNYISYPYVDNDNNFDCNGDGLVDSSDLIAITKNYGKTHLKTSQYKNGDSATDRWLYLSFSKTTYLAGDTVKADIMLGTNKDSTLNYLYGIGAVFNLDPYYVDSNTFQISFVPSWLDTPGLNMLAFVNPDFANGAFPFAVSRTDHIGRTGYGKISEMRFKIPINAIGGKIVKISGSFSSITHNILSQAYMPDDSFEVAVTTGIIPLKNSAPDIKLYPNPAKGALNIDAGRDIIKAITIFDATGKIIYNKTGQSTSKLVISLTNLSPGIYMARVFAGNSASNFNFMKE